MGREVVRLERERGSRLGRVIYRDREPGQKKEEAKEVAGEDRPWREALDEARAVAGPGKQVTVRVFGFSRDLRYNAGRTQLTEYPVQLPRETRDGAPS